MSTLTQLLTSDNFPKVSAFSPMKPNPSLVEKELNNLIGQINTLMISNSTDAQIQAEKLLHKLVNLDVPDSMKKNAIAKLPESVQSHLLRETGKGSKSAQNSANYAAEMAYMMYRQVQINNRLFSEEQMRRWANNPELLKLAHGFEAVNAEMHEFLGTQYATAEEAELAGKKFNKNLDKQLEQALQRLRQINQELNALHAIPEKDRTPEQQARSNSLIGEARDIVGMVNQMDEKIAKQRQKLSENPASQQKGTVENVKSKALEEAAKSTGNALQEMSNKTIAAFSAVAQISKRCDSAIEEHSIKGKGWASARASRGSTLQEMSDMTTDVLSAVANSAGGQDNLNAGSGATPQGATRAPLEQGRVENPETQPKINVPNPPRLSSTISAMPENTVVAPEPSQAPAKADIKKVNRDKENDESNAETGKTLNTLVQNGQKLDENEENNILQNGAHTYC